MRQFIWMISHIFGKFFIQHSFMDAKGLTRHLVQYMEPLGYVSVHELV